MSFTRTFLQVDSSSCIVIHMAIDITNFPVLCEFLENEGACYAHEQDANEKQLLKLQEEGFITLTKEEISFGMAPEFDWLIEPVEAN